MPQTTQEEKDSNNAQIDINMMKQAIENYRDSLDDMWEVIENLKDRIDYIQKKMNGYKLKK